MERPPKLAEQVAVAIKNDVVARGWPVGENLGNEAGLIARYGVSRATLREAIGILEHTQLAAMHRGRSGGLIVQQPAAHVVASTVAAHIYLAGISLDDLYDVRIHLQLLAARLASERLSEHDVAALRALVDAPTPLDESIEVTLGQISGNPVLAIVIPTLTRVTGMWAGAPQGATLAGKSAGGRRRAWQLIVDAMIAGDGAAVERRMRRSLDADRRWVEEHRSTRTPRLQASTSGKVAERVAEQLAAEVVQRQPGDVLGHEAELLERLGVTRAPLRQAVRILEHHGVVRMREGPNGGLVVCAPDPTEVVEALALYLHYIGVDARSILEVRSILEIDAAGAAASRGDAQARVKMRLEQSGPAGVDPDVHAWIAQLAGNPLTTLLVRALIGTTRLGVTDAAHQPADPPATPDRSQTHLLILEAIGQGDVSLARHRMGRHLSSANTLV
ncbi:FadR/GntR family transcriptional regulator [Nocardioides sp. Iso805N]|uniref:FadR/GntR family transcriptional regulator n=1 Tax=Nocardioides sp. Iso805N TaxID=1283287 RepID=UPI0003645E97|nr:FCD domain-containing protein [Nocardioides sp. Iso805N]